MCDLLVDVSVESGTFTTDFSDKIEVECAAGRVILAATARMGNDGSNSVAASAILADGALSNICFIDPTGLSGTGHGTTVRYCLTTGRVATL